MLAEARAAHAGHLAQLVLLATTSQAPATREAALIAVPAAAATPAPLPSGDLRKLGALALLEASPAEGEPVARYVLAVLGDPMAR